MGGGGKGSTTQTTNQNQSYSADPRVQAAGTQALSGAQSAASQPFQMPVAPVAGFSPLQQQVFNQYQNTVNQPYYQTAQSLYNQSAAPISANDINQYFLPEVGGVTAQMQNIFGQQQSQNNANLIQSAGGVGADRIAVGQGNLANQQGLAAGQTFSNIYNSAVAQAQADKARQYGAAQGIQGLGGQVIGGANAAGTMQQQQSQAELNAPYQNTLARLAYPFQTAQYLAGVTGGLAPAFGGTTIGTGNQVTTPPQPTLANQLIGLGTAGVGAYNALGGSNAFGGGNPFTDSYGGSSSNPLSMEGSLPLQASDYGTGYADGGEVDDEKEPLHENSYVPTNTLPMGAGHSGPLTGALNMSMPAPQQQSSSSGLGDIAKLATSVLPFFLAARGGDVPHYDDGGDIDWGQIGTGSPTPAPTFNDRFGAAFPRGAGSNVETNPHPVPPGTVPVPTPYPGPGKLGEDHPDAIRLDQPSTVTAKPEEEPDYAPPPNKESTPREIRQAMMPKSFQPYPDALNRDWGQNVTRSPWLSLIQAGATIASTPGPLGSAIGKGMLAGTKSLDDQRKELRSEQELNDKAVELYQKAQQHLDKYNKMVPYERESVIARNKEIDQAERGISGKNKFTGTNYQQAAEFIRNTHPGMTSDELQPLIEAEVARRKRYLTMGTPAAGNAPAVSPQIGPDPGEGKRVPGQWYIGPSGQPQQWQG